MNDLELFEAELKKLKPAAPPPEFLGELEAALARRRPAAGNPSAPGFGVSWRRWLYGWASAGAACLVALVWWASKPAALSTRPPKVQAHRTSSSLKADKVEIDQQLISAFDAVARLPDGEPVRFRCQQWADEVVLHDSVRGVTIERKIPRLEVVPVSLETY